LFGAGLLGQQPHHRVQGIGTGGGHQGLGFSRPGFGQKLGVGSVSLEHQGVVAICCPLAGGLVLIDQYQLHPFAA